MAEAEQFKPKLEGTQKYAKSVSKQIMDSPIIKNDPAFRKALTQTLNLSEPTKTTTKKVAIIVQGLLTATISDWQPSPVAAPFSM